MAPAERSGPADEKVTVNVGPVDLGKIELLVSEGLYGSRTDFIREAIRRNLDRHERTVEDTIVRKEFTVGFLSHSKKDLERIRSKRQRINVRVVGVFKLGNDVDPDLAADVFDEVHVLGSFLAPTDVIERLTERRSLVKVRR